MSEPTVAANHLHLLEDDEAKVVGMRLRALTLYENRYAANKNSQRVMVACLRSVADLSVGPAVAASVEWRSMRWRSFSWELLAAPDVVQLICAEIRTARYEGGQRIEHPYSPGRINQAQVAVRRMLHYCALVGLVSHDQVRRACDEMPKPPPKELLKIE